MQTVDINLNSEDSIRAAIQDLREYRDSTLNAKVQTFVDRVGALGVTVVNGAYSNALYAGTNDISVVLESNGSGCVIRASGASLGFIEFGTGLYTPLGDVAGEVGAPPHGTFGKKQGNRPGGWAYYGAPGNLGTIVANRGGLVHTYGNPPANAFSLARSQIEQSVAQIAMEVFG